MPARRQRGSAGFRNSKQQTSQQAPAQPGTTGVTPQPGRCSAARHGAAAGACRGLQPREQVLQRARAFPSTRLPLSGSISLKGAEIDDLQLKRYHETVDPGSPTITLLSPLGTEAAVFCRERLDGGWNGQRKAAERAIAMAGNQGAKLTPETPVKLSFDNGEGLIFHKTIGVERQLYVHDEAGGRKQELASL